MHQFNDQLTAERARAEKLEAQVAALRGVLNAIMYGDNGESWLDESFAPRDMADKACALLADTATVAAEHDARVRREALEEVAKHMDIIAGGPAYRSAAIWAAGEIRALATQTTPAGTTEETTLGRPRSWDGRIIK